MHFWGKKTFKKHVKVTKTKNPSAHLLNELKFLITVTEINSWKPSVSCSRSQLHWFAVVPFSSSFPAAAGQRRATPGKLDLRSTGNACSVSNRVLGSNPSHLSEISSSKLDILLCCSLGETSQYTLFITGTFLPSCFIHSSPSSPSLSSLSLSSPAALSLSLLLETVRLYY